jgi:hypothetical protein
MILNKKIYIHKGSQRTALFILTRRLLKIDKLVSGGCMRKSHISAGWLTPQIVPWPWMCRTKSKWYLVTSLFQFWTKRRNDCHRYSCRKHNRWRNVWLYSFQYFVEFLHTYRNKNVIRSKAEYWYWWDISINTNELWK